MDLATALGLLIGLIGIGYGMFREGGGPQAFIQDSAFMIVIGGTVGAVLISFPLRQVLLVPRAIQKSFFYKEPISAAEVVEIFVRLADKARREGLLALEEEEESLPDPFLRKGVQLVVDGTEPELIRSVLEIDIELMQKRHTEATKVLEAAGGYAPTMGIIGTVMGLVGVLQRLEDPSELGHAVAVAFVATFYGILTANLFWLPLANKLKQRTEQEVLLRQLMLEGVMAVQSGENPRIIRSKLEGFLPPAARQAGPASTPAQTPAQPAEATRT